MKVTVKRSTFSLEFTNREGRALGKVLEAIAGTRERAPLNWLLRGDDPLALYQQLAAVGDVLCSAMTVMRDDETRHSEHYAGSVEAIKKGVASVRTARHQSRMTVDCPKLPKAKRRR